MDTSDRIKRDNGPALLSTDTTATSDVLGFVLKLPDNLFWAFYDPQHVNLDDVGRLSEKAFRKYYQKGLSVLKYTAWTNPRFRKDGIKNIRAMDLDSFTYMEPVLNGADMLALNHLQPIFFNDDQTSLFDHIDTAAHNIQKLAAKIATDNGVSDETQRDYNKLIEDLYLSQQQLHQKLAAMAEDATRALEAIDAIKVPDSGKSLKRERVKALRNHVLRIQKQAVDLYRDTEKTAKDMKTLGQSDAFTPDAFATKLKDIGFTLQKRSGRAFDMARNLSDMAHTRQKREVRIWSNRKIVGTQTAAMEDYRKLKLGLDLCFVPNAAQTLPITDSGALAHNGENYFIKTVEYGLSNAFKSDGTHIPLGERGQKYGEDMGEHIAKLYSLGLAEDALYAIQLLKMSEGPKSHQVFPESFHDMVQKHMMRFYGKSEKDIATNPHAKAFLERVRDIAGNRNHSPLVWGARDTEQKYYNKVKDYIYGRMYPSSDRFIATPLAQKYIHHPLVKMRSSVIAYVTGGSVVPLSETKKKAKEGSILESEMDLTIKRGWWWAKKQEKSDENPKPAGFLARAPWWVNMPVRNAMMASVPVAAVLVTGGVAAPMYVIVPVAALGAVSAANYSLKAAKATWALPCVNKPIKFAAKWTAIIGVTAGGVYIIAPLTPAIAGWGWAMAAANPAWAAGIASPFAGLIGLKGISMLTKKSKPEPKLIAFDAYRADAGIENDSFGLVDDAGNVHPMPPAPEAIVINLQEPVIDQPGAQDAATSNLDLFRQLSAQVDSQANEIRVLRDELTRVTGSPHISGTQSEAPHNDQGNNSDHYPINPDDGDRPDAHL